MFYETSLYVTEMARSTERKRRWHVLCVMMIVCGVLCVIGAPGVPIGLHVYHVADGEICVALAPPSTNGGSEVTSYLIDASLTGMPHCRRVGTVDSTTTSFVLTDLPVGEYSTVRVFSA